LKTIKEQTGWVRPHPKAICQNPLILLQVTQFHYDLDNDDFVKYFIGRTGVVIKDYTCPRTGNVLPGPECGWEKVKDHWANPTVEIDTVHWILTRAKLQDCWELYCASLPVMDGEDKYNDLVNFKKYKQGGVSED
jgi:hypothetical protein